MTSVNENGEVWFVYDGECPLCQSAALAVRIKEELGDLKLLNARENQGHWLIREITAHEYDLDEGMVIYHQERFYHGKDALRFMARFGEPFGSVGRISRRLFRSGGLARVSYPLMRGVRNLLLKIKGVKPIGNLSRERK